MGRDAGLSESQVERTVRKWAGKLGPIGPGLRSITRDYRLRAAVTFLSAEDVPIANVAEASGYGSADAMARAFRDAGLPPPSLVRRDVPKRPVS
jgi:transcriptional regulator GlxA family with amidase domain